MRKAFPLALRRLYGMGYEEGTNHGSDDPHPRD